MPRNIKCSVEIDLTGSSWEQVITQSTQGLLLEGLRLLNKDKFNRDTEETVRET